MSESIRASRPKILHVAPGRLIGSLTPPPSKSYAHRAMICAALAGDLSCVSGIVHPSEDLRATRAAISKLLAGVDGGSGLDIDCGESGTTLRMLVPIAAALGKTVTFSGRGLLPVRPMRDYAVAFQGKGAELAFPAEGSLPLTVSGTLLAGRYELPGDITSQYVSGLLLALPLMEGASTLVMTTALQSSAYVDLTMEVMAHFGVKVDKLDPDRETYPFGGFSVQGGQYYRPAPYRVEADYSQSAFWLTANHLGSKVDILGLPAHSTQGDRAVIDWLARLDAAWKQPGGRVEIDASQIPDLVPILAVAAAFGPSETRIVNAARLRIKESDRLASTENVLRAIGADITQQEDGLLIHGQDTLSGGVADTWNDHRIAMALAIAALRTTGGVDIRDPWCIDKSYPSFFEDLCSLGGTVT